MAVPKGKAIRTLLLGGCMGLGLLLQGCGGQPLSEREIVRAVFWERQGQEISVSLLLADRNPDAAEEGGPTASARAATPTAALEAAERQLQGTAYYGLMDLTALPTETEYAQAVEIGRLLYEKAQPAPEVSVFLLPRDAPLDWAKDAAGIYDGMKACEKKEGLHCGLQQLFVQGACCALPVYAPGGCGFAVLPQRGGAIRFGSGLPAGLATVLAGQGRTISGSFAGGKAAMSAVAAVYYEDGALQLQLRELRLHDLTGTMEESSLRQTLAAELTALYEKAAAWTQAAGCDPFFVMFWKRCALGAGAGAEIPGLRVVFE